MKNEELKIRKVGIIGVGFMGGSLALSLKEKFPQIFVCGYARSKKSYDKLQKLNILDRVERDLKKVVEDADFVAIALPIYAIIDYFKKISPFLKKGAIVFDLGSSKESIEKNARSLPKNVSFVGCHPLCGSEKTGAEFSRSQLYKEALCLITSSSTAPAAKIVKNLWEKLGSKVVFLPPSLHDKILSSVSHLPHIISFSLAFLIPKDYVKFSSSSLKDITRVASSPPFIWAEIFLSNKKNILSDIAGFIKVLKSFQKVIKEEDKKKIVSLIEKINIKQKLLNGKG
ncbi:MAG: prephenate dehydrogenase [Candidatus Omnitrophica bacterium]|nr:prephenate dehydrogenase [Candidatus Omnitrophota bacterium]MBU0896782.1 prephenate dehydrogenase [Candidatus Omnitrophota bacterium]MBU1133587.1 prephenate dehydrogenase [Candidatus Omnitrophota bacterium]MBU1810405.1 prephenate dehydrogenase [Candidatus Omnitrophota bacterium]MBU2504672.1 prephenate dehydrogenase [Candidatus Omnitrophota bacterium]